MSRTRTLAVVALTVAVTGVGWREVASRIVDRSTPASTIIATPAGRALLDKLVKS